MHVDVGTFGEVLATGTVPKCSAEAGMQLRYQPEGAAGSAIVATIAQGTVGAAEMTETRHGTTVALLAKGYTGEVST